MSWKEQKMIFPDCTLDGVLYEFLIRLPVNSLLRFKSVSKSWFSLISNPNFVKSHLAITANRTLIVHTCDYESNDPGSISLINLDSPQLVSDFQYMPVGDIVGSANGIVCVCASNIYLWNPATKQYKTIPDNDDIIRWRGIFGFGFDPVDNDFKFVKVMSHGCAVYSVNRNAWRMVVPSRTDFPYFPYYDNFDVCVNGFLCSVGLCGMMAFDLNREVLTCAIKLPVTTFDVTITDFQTADAGARIIDFNASIAVIIYKRDYITWKTEINLWALDDESCLRGGGIQASWTLMLNIDVNKPVQHVHSYFNTGDILLLVDDVWSLYNSDTKEYRNFTDSFFYGQIFNCPESLVSIAGFKQVNLNPPDHVIIKILLGLPFDSLLRFKSVSKSWLSLISSPNFAKSQLAITNTREPDQIHIVHSYNYEDESDTSILLVDIDTRQIVADLNFPFSRGDFPCMPRSLLVGCACGIVCVHSAFSNASRIYLWNPATKQSKRIPSHNIRDVGIERVVLGFGFDPIGNDFKVVRIVSPSFSAEVYSANRNDWQNVKPNPIDFPNDKNFDVCVNGFLCTAGRYGMIAFDLKTEVFNCAIKFPAPTFDASITELYDFDPHAHITKFNDSIAAIICKRNENNCKINLWALDDEACLRGGGIQASWTLMLNIDVNQPVQFVHGYFNGGDFLLLNDGVWYLYNPENEEARNSRNFTDAFYCGQMFSYTKSLFKFAGSKQVNWNIHEDDSEDDN